MSKTAERSNLIDVTYQQLHSILSGHQEGTVAEQLSLYISPRIPQLSSISEPFGKPSDASKKSINSGTVTLPDGVKVVVENADKDCVLAISSAFHIDEINALILFRSFLYNEGLPQSTGSDLTEELVEAIVPFYFSERLHVLRVLLPLLRARESPSDLFHDFSKSIIPKLLPNGHDFVSSLITHYLQQIKEPLPEKYAHSPKLAGRWAKQASKEQLVLLEVLFWLMWGYVPCSGLLVRTILSAAYQSNLGSALAHNTLLLDEEGLQLQQDIAGMWILITIEVLELETIAEPATIEISDDPSGQGIYTSSPTTLTAIHDMVSSNHDTQFTCTYLAWTFVVFRLTASVVPMQTVPAAYQSFVSTIMGREPIHLNMIKLCLEPNRGLFKLLSTLLTTSPLFVTAAAWRTGSTVTDPNAVAFRSVLKGLVMALVEIVPVEHIPDFDALVDVWVALFGRSEPQSVTAICRQFWQADWRQGVARRALFDVARSRFPVQARPLMQLLRAMTASGFIDTDPLATHDYLPSHVLSEDQKISHRHVFYYFDHLPTYTQTIPLSACSGPQACYERQQDRFGNSGVVMYTTLRRIQLPGGVVLEPGTMGHLISGDGGDGIVVSWIKEYSGWRLLLEILSKFVTSMTVDFRGGYNRSNDSDVVVSMQESGFDLENGVDDELITEIFDLIRSVIQDDLALSEQLMGSLESTNTASTGYDLVQIVTNILEASLSRANRNAKESTPVQLITSALGILTKLLAIRRYSTRVWIYIRSTHVLFGSEKSPGFLSFALVSERTKGQYNMTSSLLDFIQHLFNDASQVDILEDVQLRHVKDEVLLRAIRFMHTEIWTEHVGWKYARLGDRFDIGRRISTLYAAILNISSPDGLGSFAALNLVLLDMLLFNTTSSAINPLISSISSGGQILRTLLASRRVGDARRLIFLLESHLRLMRLLLEKKRQSLDSSKPSLLEQSLCSRASMESMTRSSTRLDPVDALAGYIKGRESGSNVPLESMRLLFTLCTCLASYPRASLTGHLSQPEAFVTTLVHVVRHPYEDLSLRFSAWRFISLCMDKEPALARLLVAGKFHGPEDIRSEGKVQKKPDQSSALDVARDTLVNWEELWEVNPQLLASVCNFLSVLWSHGQQHGQVLHDLQKDATFWALLTSLACADLGPFPAYETREFVHIDGVRHSSSHDAVSMYCYRTMAKASALTTIASDLRMNLKSGSTIAPTSLTNMATRFKSEDELTEMLSEAAPNPYRPELYDELQTVMETQLPGLRITQFAVQEPADERDFGDDFAFSRERLHNQLQLLQDRVQAVESPLQILNLNLSLTHSQTRLAECWQELLQVLIPHLRGNNDTRRILLSTAASLSGDIAQESRKGDMAAAVHKSRLGLLLSILELAWLSDSNTPSEIGSFVELANNLQTLALNQSQPASQSLLRAVTTPFHTPLFRIFYFSLKFARGLTTAKKALNGDQRIQISLMTEAAFNLVLDGLRIVFISARTRQDVDLDGDMQLLVGLFEQCTSSDLISSSTQWLSRCQESDIFRLSLDLYAHIDLVGLSDLPSLLSRKQPLYAPHLLMFHMCLASMPTSAERLANGGLLEAYGNNMLGPAMNSGRIDTGLPELPAERSPAHSAFCSMLAVTAGVVTAMGRNNHYLDAEICGFIQLCGAQIVRTLSWTVGDSISLPFLDELEHIVHLFYSLARNSPSAQSEEPMVQNVLHIFTTKALTLMQQLNYALSHPHHLASLFEPVTDDELRLMEAEQTVSEPLKRPLMAHLLQRLFRLSSNILSALICISRAEVVLLGPRDQSSSNPVVALHSKVALTEPASIGTLIEMGNCSLDTLKYLVNLPAAEKTIPTNSTVNQTFLFEKKDSVAFTCRNLESILLYTVTQLALSLSQADHDTGDMEMDDAEASAPRELTNDRRPRTQTSRADRLRRGRTGEMAADLQSLLNKAKAVMAKSDGILGGNSGADLVKGLSTWLQDCIITPAQT